MECPNCKGELRLNTVAEHNIEAYGKPLTVVALCCGTGVVIRRVVTIKASPYRGSETHDDWGNPIKPINSIKPVEAQNEI